MSMLIGVLCEVVSQVSRAEKENAAVKLMRNTLVDKMKTLDEDGSGSISKDEMRAVLKDPHLVEVLWPHCGAMEP